MITLNPDLGQYFSMLSLPCIRTLNIPHLWLFLEHGKLSIDCFSKQPLNGWLVGQTRFTPSFLRRGTGGDRNPGREGKIETIPNTYCHHQNYVCIKMGSNRSHFNVSLIVRGKVKRQCPYPQLFEKREESNQSPSAYQPNALPRGQTGSQPPLNKHNVLFIVKHILTPPMRETNLSSISGPRFFRVKISSMTNKRK